MQASGRILFSCRRLWGDCKIGATKRLLRVFVTLCLAVAVYQGAYYFYTMERNMPLSREFRRLQALLTSPSDFSTVCKVPELNPFDPSILKYIVAQEPLHCEPVQPQMAKLIDGDLQFNATLFASATCSYRNVSHNEGKSDFEAKLSDSMPIELDSNSRFQFDNEMIQVECSFKITNLSYIMHFSTVKPREHSLLYNTTKIETSSVERPSVIMIGMDSISRSNFIRQLNRTHAKMQSMGFIDMLGQVKIGDNTYVNWMAILTGKHAVSSWEFSVEREEPDDTTYFDDDDMVWRNFSKSGYATLFAEDLHQIGTFTILGQRCGFKHQPTDHYFRPFWLAAEASGIAGNMLNYCYDSMGKQRIQLDYLASFLRAYERKRKFSFWWSNILSHNELNPIGKGDADFEDFFIQNERLLNDSIVVVFSDHGQRFDGIRETIVGRLEARLPMLSIRIPPAIDERFPHLKRMLRENSKKLTTPFDLHESLNVLATSEFANEEPKTNSTEKRRGYSIFHSIPNRSCLEAHVPDDFCPCYVEKEIPVDEAQKPAQILLESINELLSANASGNNPEKDPVASSSFMCAPLELANITYASVRIPPAQVIKDVWSRKALKGGLEIVYRIMLVAKPSDALIEGVVVKDEASGKWSTTGEYERNNRYGNTSHCVSDPVLKKLCFCVPKNDSPSAA